MSRAVKRRKPGRVKQSAKGRATHVSGTIRALLDNQVGINGICACQLSVYKIFGDDPAGRPVFSPFPHFPYYVDPILYRAALAACQGAGVRVINLSIGDPGAPDPQESALFQALIGAGVAVVAAMGNEGSSRPSYPAAIPGVIAVGATGLDDSRADFSNSGPHIALCAPGVAIWSTLPTYAGQTGFYAVQGPGGTWVRGRPMARETDYDAWQGTSMATPHVSAAAALAFAKHGGLSASAMKSRLMQAIDKVPRRAAPAVKPRGEMCNGNVRDTRRSPLTPFPTCTASTPPLRRHTLSR